MFDAIELGFIRFIHEFRTPLLDHFFKLFDFFDRQEFFFVLIPIIWLGNGWKAGLRLFYIILLNSLTNHFAKEFFSSPRPFHIDHSLGIIQVIGYGFPSGAAQSVVLLSGILLTYWKSPWAWLISFFYVLSVSFSRVYLGVHFPSDILGGWLIGLLLWLFFIYIQPSIEKWFKNFQPQTLFLSSQLFPATFLYWKQSVPIIHICPVAMGMGCGIFIHHIYQWILPSPQNWKEYMLRAAIGVFGTFLCYALTLTFSLENPTIESFLRFFLLGLWVSLGSMLLSRKLCRQETLLHHSTTEPVRSLRRSENYES
jgi:undecaprenyl-diphosphatase